jgi:hypothetical protein
VLRQELGANGLAELALPRFGLEEPARKTLASYRQTTPRTAGVP